MARMVYCRKLGYSLCFKMRSIKAAILTISSSIVVLWLGLVTSVFAIEHFVETLGVSLPNQLNLAKTQESVYLNGHAVAQAWGQPAYVAALYTPYIEKRAEMLSVNDEPLAMVFYFIRDDVTADMLRKLFTESILVNNGGWDNQRLDRKRILELQNLLNRTFNAGDVLAFHYSPKNGVLMIVNSEVEHHWPHAKSFFNMLLRMWVGPYPPSRGFKRAILNFPANMQ
ncbi:MAG: hypothetical protein BGO43_14460 [Gammaproteobacteria bacterium 39-13]|nr:chalcone isomerase family protein [Gammaproteobacteria bacterium]OJV88496.1 MAG: hypothetical protein BGO43_14460 [Gammaproteobacteria bacterium 39-13]